MNLTRTKSNVLVPYLCIVFSMSSVTSQIELKKCYCVIIAVGGELKCKIKTAGDYLEQSGDESTLQEYCVRSTCRCNNITSRDDVECSVGSWMKLSYNVQSYFMCILYNERDATYPMFFIIISALYVSDGFSAHHQELIKLYVQPWVLSCFPAVHRWCGWVGTHPHQRQTAGKHGNNQGCTYSFISS